MWETFSGGFVDKTKISSNIYIITSAITTPFFSLVDLLML